jgi:cytochrome c-type biogenesis protein CcmH/NrfG
LIQTDPSYIPVQARFVELMAQQNPTAAMRYVEDLIAKNPENIDVYFLQGNIAEQTGNLRQAGTAYEAILSLQSENIDALSALGGIRFRQRRYQSAVEAFSHVLTLQPDHAIARAALTDLEQILRRRVPALRQAEQVQPANLPMPGSDLSRSQPQPATVEFLPQGDTPLPWNPSDSQSPTP